LQINKFRIFSTDRTFGEQDVKLKKDELSKKKNKENARKLKEKFGLGMKI
jgi:hypothetical protein